jgi:hypothetical protein
MHHEWTRTAISTALGLFAAWFCLFVHELGHLVAGMAVGFRFQLFTLGPLRIDRGPDGRLRIGWNRDLHLAGGAQAATPTDTGRLCPRLAVAVMSGPLAGLLLALAAHLMLLAWPGAPWAVRATLGWVRLISAALAVGTLLPIANGPFVNDGLRFLRLLGRGPLAEREAGLLTWVAQEGMGVPARERDAAALERVLAVRDGSMFECQGWLWACERARELGRLDEAAAALERARPLAAKAPAELRESCEREAAAIAAAREATARS